MRAEPVSEVGLRDFACGQCQEGDHKLGVGGMERMAVDRQEGFADDCCGPLIAVGEGMIARDTEGIGGGKCGDVRFPIADKLERPGYRAFEQSHVPHTDTAAMLGNLLGMDGSRGIGANPVIERGHLLGEFAKRPLAPRHHLARCCHLRIEICIGGG